MKKTTILKSLIVAAGMLVGTSAWAQTTLYERGTTNAWSASDIGEGAWSAANYGTAEITADGLKYTSPENGSGSTTLSLTTKENSKLVWSFTWNTGESTGRAGNKNYLKFGDVELKAMGQDPKSTIVIGGVETQLSTAKEDVRGSVVWTGTITIDKASGEVSYEIVLPKSGKKTGTGVLASTDFSSVVLGFEKGGRTTTSSSTLQKIEITEEEQAVTTADYTVKYLCGTTEVKEAVTRTGVVGQSIVLSASDKESFFSADGNTKYLYASDNSSEVTIASDGNTVVNVYFTAAGKLTYVVKAVDESDNELATIGSVSGFDGETLEVFWSKYVKVGDQWYVADAPFYQGGITESGEKKVTYKESDIAYFIECENMINVRTDRWVLETNANNSGYRKIRQNSYYRTLLTEALEDGIYDLAIPYDNSNSSNSDATIQLVSGGVTTDLATWTTERGAKTYTLKSIVVPAGAQIGIYYAGDGNSNARMDYLTLTPSKETKSISAAGYATYYSANALDFTGTGLTAYVATVSGSEVSFTEVEKVPAQTGVLLKGAAGEYQIPVVADGGSATSALVGVLEDTKVLAGSYVLMKGEQGVGFYKTTTEFTVGANTAYLPAQTTTARSFIGFDGESSTGISAVESSVLSTEVYDLQGRRVAQPTKGLYIMNGKKTVVR